MALVEVKEPLVFLNEELCLFVLKSPNISSHWDFQIILTDLSEQVLQALKRFFLLLESRKKTTRATSLCLTIDFSKVLQGEGVDVYKFLLQNIGPEVTELRLSGMENHYLDVHPFSVANSLMVSTSSFPHLHTTRISNLGGRENILWLSYFLNGAKNLKQLHLGPFEDIYIKGLGKWEEEAYSLLPSSAKIGSKNDIRLEQLKLLGHCINFEEMRQATLFIKGLSISTFSVITNNHFVRKSWDGKAESEIGVGIPIPMKIQIQVNDQRVCDDTMVNALCTTPSLVVLSGLGFYSSEPYLPRSLPSSFHGLEKLEMESTATWLMDNLEKLPSLKHLVWRPLWSEASQKRQNQMDLHDVYYDFQICGRRDSKLLLLEQQILTSLNQIKLLTAEKPASIRHNLEIFRIVQDWTSCKILPPAAFEIIKLFSSNFPRLKTLACEVSDSAQVETLLQLFPQVKEFHFNKYVPIAEIRTEVSREIPQKTTKKGRNVYVHSKPALIVSYKLENFGKEMTSFKAEVEQHQSVCFKEVAQQTPIVKIGAFIFDKSMNIFRPGQQNPNIEMILSEIASAISNLNLFAIVIPVQSHLETDAILEAIKSEGPKELKHVHFQIKKCSGSYLSYQGLEQDVIESYAPFFLVTNDLEPGKNNLSCSVLVKDFWE